MLLQHFSSSSLCRRRRTPPLHAAIVAAAASSSSSAAAARHSCHLGVVRWRRSHLLHAAACTPLHTPLRTPLSSQLLPICLSRRRHPLRSLLTGLTDTVEFESCAIWTGQHLEPWITPSGSTNGVHGIRTPQSWVNWRWSRQFADIFPSASAFQGESPPKKDKVSTQTGGLARVY